jgi:small redox-active disulfide protein 2
MLTIKILGPGCLNCRKVEEVARHAALDLGLEAKFEKVTDYGAIMGYPILATPGLVINDEIVCNGRIPGDAEVAAWLEKAVSAG